MNRPLPMSASTLRAAKLDPESPRQWARWTLASLDGAGVVYRGRLTNDGVVVLTGGSYTQPCHCEYDVLAILRTICLDVARRHPDLNLDADELARDAVATVGQRLRRERAWTVSELEVV